MGEGGLSVRRYRYELQTADQAGETRHPQIVIREHFPDAHDFEPAPIGDCWLFAAEEPGPERAVPGYFVALPPTGGKYSWAPMNLVVTEPIVPVPEAIPESAPARQPAADGYVYGRCVVEPAALDASAPFVASRPELGAPPASYPTSLPEPRLAPHRPWGQPPDPTDLASESGGAFTGKPADDHRGPWKWSDSHGLCLVDANGDSVLWTETDDLFVHGPRVRAIIEAGGEWPTCVTALLAYLQEAFDDGWRPKSEDVGPGCYKARKLLDGIDKAGR